MHRPLTIALLCVLVAAAALLAVRSAPAGPAGNRSLPKWDYAKLVLGQDRPVFCQAERQSRFLAPLAKLADKRGGESAAGDRYVMATRALRDHDVAALNLLGAEGWEAISMATRGSGLVVLMRRPAR